MDRFFRYIEQYKVAIVGTALFHVAVFLCTNFTTVSSTVQLQEDILEGEIPFDEIELDPKMLELLDLADKVSGQPQDVVNTASDENDTRQTSSDHFSTSAIDEEVMNDAKSLEKQYFAEWAATHEGPDIETDEDPEEDDPLDNNNKPDNATIHTNGDFKAAGDVLVSFNLKDRKAFSLPKPGYTCNRSGTVKLDIKVDNNGSVKSVVFNEAGSQNADECMINQALTYAKKSRFNLSSTAPAPQSGTVTYKFVGQ